ncbi:hypothetical protein WY02_05705 [Pseudonocardia sp. AL041005-10]|nr:hypothetical protein WY02_05705 [Pseudonocardia sp. AL041005-10]
MSSSSRGLEDARGVVGQRRDALGEHHDPRVGARAHPQLTQDLDERVQLGRAVDLFRQLLQIHQRGVLRPGATFSNVMSRLVMVSSSAACEDRNDLNSVQENSVQENSAGSVTDFCRRTQRVASSWSTARSAGEALAGTVNEGPRSAQEPLSESRTLGEVFVRRM